MEALNQSIDFHGKSVLNLHNFHINSTNQSSRKEHRHHYLEISYVKKGSGCYKVEDKYYDMQEGDVFVLNNIESHVICDVSPYDELVNMVIHFEPRFIWSSESNFFDSRYLKIFFDRNENFQNRLDRNNPATHEIRKLLLEIEEEFLNKQVEYELMIKVKLLNILVNLIRHYGYTKESKDTSTRMKQDIMFMNKVIDYIDSHLSEDIKLSTLSEIAHVNSSYFSTLFKKYNGISPTDYIARKRIYKAMELIKSSDKSILEIAGACGFNNAANFNKTFKKITGKTPTYYRNNI